MNRCNGLARIAVWWTTLVVGLASALGQPNPLRPDSAAPSTSPPRPHILLIMVDDLRPELGCYGHPQIHSPRIDALASRSMQFNRAYCMVPTCGASRASLMTGLRPTEHRFLKHSTRISRDAPRALPLHTALKLAGYTTVSLGKVIHHGDDQQGGWSTPPWRPNLDITDEEDDPGRANRLRVNPNWAGPAFRMVPADDSKLIDVQIADRAIEELSQLQSRGKPFFLAVGFVRPHLPFVAPQVDWERYPADTIRMPDHARRPPGIPPQALHPFGELRNYQDIPKTGPLSDALARQLIRGYYASVSHVDEQIGRVLDALDQLQLTEDTIIVLWGDHGWNLGEHGLWCKHCCFETSLRIPLLLRVPGKPAGVQVDGLVESIDLYPTLCELAGVPVPGHVHGTSWAGSLDQPERIDKGYAISRFGRGDSLRTDRYRYTEYREGDGRNPVARMLFDHSTDPDERVNLADSPEYREVVAQLGEQLGVMLEQLAKEPQTSPRRSPIATPDAY